MLLSRNYNRNVVRSAIERASKLDRLEVLKRVVKTESKRISCNKCSKQYVGQTTRKFQTRIKEHIGDIKNNRDTVCAIHFNSRGHSIDNLRVQIIEKVCPNTANTLLEREKLWIQTIVTRKPHGLNAHD